MRFAIAVVVVVCGACVAASPGDNSLVETVPASAAACPNGGVEIDSGVDTNHDGALEPSEVTSRQDVCSPAPTAPIAAAPQQLVRVVAEPAGSNCVNGGVAVETGSDTNGNGVLDDGEVSSTTYVCAGEDGSSGAAGSNGAPGSNGSNASNILVRVVTEPAGSNCAAGGEAILVGADTNDDGILEDSEVEDTAFLCNAPPIPTVIDGDYTIANDLDVAALAGVTEITGNVTFTSSTITSLSLPNLQHVGSFTMATGVFPLSTLSLPALLSVGPDSNPGEIQVDATIVDLSSLVSGGVSCGGELDTLTLPSLRTGGITLRGGPGKTTSLSTSLELGTVELIDTLNLTTMTLDSLRGGTIFVNDAPALQRLDLPALESSTGIFNISSAIGIQGAASLTEVIAPNLVTGDIGIAGVPALTTLDLSSLQTGQFAVSNSGLTALSLPALASSSNFGVFDNPNLASISAPSLSGSTFFEAEDDSELPTCEAQALAAQAHAINVTISGTNDAATCP